MAHWAFVRAKAWRVGFSLILGLLVLLPPDLSRADLWADRSTVELAVAGTDHLLNLDYDLAEQTFARLNDADGTGLLAPLYQAFVTLSRLQDREPTRQEMDAFLVAMRALIAKAEARLKQAPEEPDTLLYLGMAWGSKAMIDGVLGNYFSAYEAIKRTKSYLDACLLRQPNRYDAYYGLGLYDYTLSRIAWFYRPLVHLALPPGDRERGLRELKIASERGSATRMLAKLALLQTYASIEKEFEKALPLAEELLRRFPGNPELYFQTALVYSELGRFPEALEVGRRIRANLELDRHHFTGQMRPRYFQLMGKIYMDRGDYPRALSFFKQAVEQPADRYAWVTAWAWTRTGMIHDLLGKRTEAERSYRMALAIKTDSIAKDVAKQYLHEPYRKETVHRTPPATGSEDNVGSP
ncbi:MAG: tetratricopeptide repeat protein [candidate division NC10 bacterium]|nr:tetratricopeptide repeat protein [candidate division NC10 bacterium]MDE2321916.1 tetratricopeptide repeat protein [candidate division NC10 bacterium]